MSEWQRLQALPFFKNAKVVAMTPLPGGLNHVVHKVTTDQGTVVTRQSLGQANPFSELRIQKALAALDLSANVLDSNDDTAVIEYLEGDHPTPSFWHATTLDIFAKQLRRVHEYQPKDEVSTLTLASYIKQCVITDGLTAVEQRLVVQALTALTPLYDMPLDKGLCHHDLNPLNIIVRGDHIWLIDWESVALSDVYFDLASFVVEQHLSTQQQQLFITSYFNYSGIQIKPLKLSLMQLAYTLVCWCWYIQQDNKHPVIAQRSKWFYQKLTKLTQQRLV